ncbi:MAG: alpha-amylase, partial [bacterium]|nr:alpha-amylase [bacterium]
NLTTARGIPQILYGTEINLLGGRRHIDLRADFPGGFPEHRRSAFAASGRSADEEAMFQFVRRLLGLRRTHPALSRGRMIHFPPTRKNDVYKYLKIHETEEILVVANGHPEARLVDLTELSHRLVDTRRFRDLMSGEEVDWDNGSVEVPALTARVLLVQE